jgi:hypothetical protein
MRGLRRSRIGVRLRLVDIQPPAWYLKDTDCPCCQEGNLKFCTCPTCGVVVLICDEIGEALGISGQQCGPVIGSAYDEQTCGNCGGSTYMDFRSSTSDEIRALGFRWPGDYY